MEKEEIKKTPQEIFQNAGSIWDLLDEIWVQDLDYLLDLYPDLDKAVNDAYVALRKIRSESHIAWKGYDPHE